jgi:hypothetical protein
MSNIRNQAMLVSLNIGLFNPKKMDRSVTREVLISKNASANAGAFVKNILPDEAIKPIQAAASALRAWVYTQTLPWNDESFRLLPVAQWDSFTDQLRARIASVNSLVDQFCSQYEMHRDKALLQLGALADPKDYPPLHVVRTKFYVNVNYTPLPDSRDFRLDDMPEEAMSELREQADLRVAEAVSEARNDLYRRLSERLEHIVKRMNEVSAKKEGTRIHASLLTNLSELCQLIPALNVTKDQELENLRQRVMHEIAPFDIDDIRESEDSRTELKKKASSILEAMGFNPVNQQREAA